MGGLLTRDTKPKYEFRNPWYYNTSRCWDDFQVYQKAEAFYVDQMNAWIEKCNDDPDVDGSYIEENIHKIEEYNKMLLKYPQKYGEEYGMTPDDSKEQLDDKIPQKKLDEFIRSAFFHGESMVIIDIFVTKLMDEDSGFAFYKKMFKWTFLGLKYRHFQKEEVPKPKALIKRAKGLPEKTGDLSLEETAERIAKNMNYMITNRHEEYNCGFYCKVTKGRNIGFIGLVTGCCIDSCRSKEWEYTVVREGRSVREPWRNLETIEVSKTWIEATLRETPRKHDVTQEGRWVRFKDTKVIGVVTSYASNPLRRRGEWYIQIQCVNEAGQLEKKVRTIFTSDFGKLEVILAKPTRHFTENFLSELPM